MSTDQGKPQDQPTPPPVATATATIDGNMGLRGLWALIGNSTSMVIICVLVFVLYRDFSSSLKDTIKENREEFRETHRNTLSHGDKAVEKIEHLDKTMQALVVEMRAGREAMERLEWVEKGGRIPVFGGVEVYPRPTGKGTQ